MTDAPMPNTTSRLRTLLAVVATVGLMGVGATSVITSAEPTEASAVPVVSVSQTVPADTADAPVALAADVEDGTFHSDGRASYYGRRFAGRPTASGERFDPTEMTAAHRTLPFGTRLRVTSERTGKSVVVRVNDRGPFHGERILDLSRAAADAIGLTTRGTGHVRLDVLDEAPRAVRG